MDKRTGEETFGLLMTAICLIWTIYYLWRSDFHYRHFNRRFFWTFRWTGWARALGLPYLAYCLPPVVWLGVLFGLELLFVLQWTANRLTLQASTTLGVIVADPSVSAGLCHRTKGSSLVLLRVSGGCRYRQTAVRHLLTQDRAVVVTHWNDFAVALYHISWHKLTSAKLYFGHIHEDTINIGKVGVIAMRAEPILRKLLHVKSKAMSYLTALYNMICSYERIANRGQSWCYAVEEALLSSGNNFYTLMIGAAATAHRSETEVYGDVNAHVFSPPTVTHGHNFILVAVACVGIKPFTDWPDIVFIIAFTYMLAILRRDHPTWLWLMKYTKIPILKQPDLHPGRMQEARYQQALILAKFWRKVLYFISLLGIAQWFVNGSWFVLAGLSVMLNKDTYIGLQSGALSIIRWYLDVHEDDGRIEMLDTGLHDGANYEGYFIEHGMATERYLATRVEFSQRQADKAHTVMFAPYGSRGDHTPLQYAKLCLDSLRVPAAFNATYTAEQAVRQMANMDAGTSADCWLATHRVSEAIKRQSNIYQAVITGPALQTAAPNVHSVRYDDPLSVPGLTLPSTLQTMFLPLVSSSVTPVCSIAGGPDSWPQSPDGERALRYVGQCRNQEAYRMGSEARRDYPELSRDELFNAATTFYGDDWRGHVSFMSGTGLENSILVGGSASFLAAREFPQHNYVHACTAGNLRPPGNYLITCTDHMDVFRYFDVVWYHGGAGTAKTAVACGAQIKSLCGLTDRALAPQGHRYQTSLFRTHSESVLGTILWSDAMRLGWLADIWAGKLSTVPTRLSVALTLLCEIPLLTLAKALICGLSISGIAAWKGLGLLTSLTVCFLYAPTLADQTYTTTICFSLLLGQFLGVRWFSPCTFVKLGLLQWATWSTSHMVLRTMGIVLGSFIDPMWRAAVTLVFYMSGGNDLGHGDRSVTVYFKKVMGMFSHAWVRAGAVDYLTDVKMGHELARMRTAREEGPDDTLVGLCPYLLRRKGPAATGVVDSAWLKLTLPIDLSEFVHPMDHVFDYAPYGSMNNCLTSTYRLLDMQPSGTCWVAKAIVLSELCRAWGLLAIIDVLRVSYPALISIFEVRLGFAPWFGNRDRKLQRILKKFMEGDRPDNDELRYVVVQKHVLIKDGNVRKVSDEETYANLRPYVLKHMGGQRALINQLVEEEKARPGDAGTPEDAAGPRSTKGPNTPGGRSGAARGPAKGAQSRGSKAATGAPNPAMPSPAPGKQNVPKANPNAAGSSCGNRGPQTRKAQRAERDRVAQDVESDEEDNYLRKKKKPQRKAREKQKAKAEKARSDPSHKANVRKSAANKGQAEAEGFSEDEPREEGDMAQLATEYDVDPTKVEAERSRMCEYVRSLRLTRRELKSLEDLIYVVNNVIRVRNYQSMAIVGRNTFDKSNVTAYHGRWDPAANAEAVWRTALQIGSGTRSARRTLYHGLRMFRCGKCGTPSGYVDRTPNKANPGFSILGEPLHKFSSCCFVLPRATQLGVDPIATARGLKRHGLVYRGRVPRVGGPDDFASIAAGYSALVGFHVRGLIRTREGLLCHMDELKPHNYTTMRGIAYLGITQSEMEADPTTWRLHAVTGWNAVESGSNVSVERVDPCIRPTNVAPGDNPPEREAVSYTFGDVIRQYIQRWSSPRFNGKQISAMAGFRLRCWEYFVELLEKCPMWAVEVGTLLSNFLAIGYETCTGGLSRNKPAIPTSTGFESNVIRTFQGTRYTLHENPIAPHILIPEIARPGEVLENPKMFFENKAFEMEDVMEGFYHKHNQILAMAANPMETRRDYKRIVNRNPYIDAYLSDRRARAFSYLEAHEGTNSAIYGTPAVKKESLQRYAKAPNPHLITEELMDEYVTAVRGKYPEIYNGFQLLPLKSAIKVLKAKVSPGLGLEGAVYKDIGKRAIRKRADVFKDKKLLQSIIDMAKDDLEARYLDPAVHHSFPKDYKDFVAKLELNPLKIRTVVAPPMYQLLADKVLFHTTDSIVKYYWRESDFTVGTPFLGPALNATLTSMPPARQRIVIDLVAFDSDHPEPTPRLLGKLYGPGFNRLAPAMQRVVSRQIETRWRRTYGGGVIKDIEDGFLVPHAKGSTTGSVSVTRVNCEVNRFVMLMGLSYLTKKPIQWLLDHTDNELMGDDGMWQLRDFTINIADLPNAVKMATGVGVKVEFNSISPDDQPTASWNGAKYLSHYIRDATVYEEEFIRAGFKPGSPVFPRYAIQYDPLRAAMRQTVEYRKLNLFQKYDSALSYAQKSLHNYPLYVQCAENVKQLRPMLMKVKGGKKFMEKKPLEPYHIIMNKFYTKSTNILTYRARETTLSQAIAQVANEAFRGIATFSTYMRRSGIEHLGSPRTGAGVKGLFHTGAYPVESYIYAHIQTQSPVVPYAQFVHGVSQTAFSSVTFPYEAYSQLSKGPSQVAMMWYHHARMVWLHVVFNVVRLSWMWLTGVSKVLALWDRFYRATIGSPRSWWGLISSINILSVGAPDQFIGSLIHKDPYIFTKNVAALIIAMIPPYAFFLTIPRIVFIFLNKLLVYTTNRLARRDVLMSPEEVAYGRSDEGVWESVFQLQIRPLLCGNLPVAVHSPTGTGKSAALGDLLQSYFEQVIYVESQVKIAKEMRGFTFVHRGVPFPDGRFKATVTAGHMLNKAEYKGFGARGKRVYVWDEYDSGDPASLLLFHKLAQEGHKMVLISATPEASILDEYSVTQDRIIDMPLEPPHAILSHPPEDGASLLHQIMAEYNKTTGRVLVIMVGEQDCIRMKNTLESYDVPAGIYARGREVPEDPVILGTQAAEKGVTIPDVSVVIDTGDMMRNHMGQLVYIRMNMATSVQRQGRTGRTRRGIYIPMKEPIDFKTVAYPDLSLFFQSPEFFGSYLGLNFEVTSPPTTDEQLMVTKTLTFDLHALPHNWQDGMIADLVAKILLRSPDLAKLETRFAALLNYMPDPGLEDLLDSHVQAIDAMRTGGVDVATRQLRTVIGRKPLGTCIDKNLVKFSTGYLYNRRIVFGQVAPPLLDLRTSNEVVYQPGGVVSRIYGTPAGTSYRMFDLFQEEADVHQRPMDSFWALVRCQILNDHAPISRNRLHEWVLNYLTPKHRPSKYDVYAAKAACAKLCQDMHARITLYFRDPTRGPSVVRWNAGTPADQIVNLLLDENGQFHFIKVGMVQYAKWRQNTAGPVKVNMTKGVNYSRPASMTSSKPASVNSLSASDDVVSEPGEPATSRKPRRAETPQPGTQTNTSEEEVSTMGHAPADSRAKAATPDSGRGTTVTPFGNKLMAGEQANNNCAINATLGMLRCVELYTGIDITLRETSPPSDHQRAMRQEWSILLDCLRNNNGQLETEALRGLFGERNMMAAEDGLWGPLDFNEVLSTTEANILRPSDILMERTELRGRSMTQEDIDELYHGTIQAQAAGLGIGNSDPTSFWVIGRSHQLDDAGAGLGAFEVSSLLASGSESQPIEQPYDRIIERSIAGLLGDRYAEVRRGPLPKAAVVRFEPHNLTFANLSVISTQWVTDTSGEMAEMQPYDLVALGLHKSGHEYCFIQDIDTHWYRVDGFYPAPHCRDLDRLEIDSETRLRAAVYVRRDTEKAGMDSGETLVDQGRDRSIDSDSSVDELSESADMEDDRDALIRKIMGIHTPVQPLWNIDRSKIWRACNIKSLIADHIINARAVPLKAGDCMMGCLSLITLNHPGLKHVIDEKVMEHRTGNPGSDETDVLLRLQLISAVRENTGLPIAMALISSTATGFDIQVMVPCFNENQHLAELGEVYLMGIHGRSCVPLNLHTSRESDNHLPIGIWRPPLSSSIRVVAGVQLTIGNYDGGLPDWLFHLAPGMEVGISIIRTRRVKHIKREASEAGRLASTERLHEINKLQADLFEGYECKFDSPMHKMTNCPVCSIFFSLAAFQRRTVIFFAPHQSTMRAVVFEGHLGNSVSYVQSEEAETIDEQRVAEVNLTKTAGLGGGVRF